MYNYRLVKISGRANWHVEYTKNGERIRKTLGTPEKEVAKTRLEDLIAQQKDEEKAGLTTIEELVTAYIREIEIDKVSPETLWSRSKAIFRHLGNLKPSHLDINQCREYAKRRYAEDVTDGTIISEMSLLSCSLGYAYRARLIDRTPNLWWPKAPPPRERFLEHDEGRRLLKACKLSHLKLFVIIALNTGARSGAITDLTWDHVDFEKGLIDFRLPGKVSKNKHRAVVPMGEVLRNALLSAKEIANSDHVIDWAGSPIKSIKKSFAKAVQKANLENVIPHTLRHTAATWMAMAGVPIDKISRMLGHTNIQTTIKIYIKFQPDYLREPVDSIDPIMSKIMAPRRKRLKRHRM